MIDRTGRPVQGEVSVRADLSLRCRQRGMAGAAARLSFGVSPLIGATGLDQSKRPGIGLDHQLRSRRGWSRVG